MARLVKKIAHGPMTLEPQKNAVHICMCGLSKNQPFCDQSHMKTIDEEEQKVYVYSDEKSRKEVCDCGSDSKCDCRSACCGSK